MRNWRGPRPITWSSELECVRRQCDRRVRRGLSHIDGPRAPLRDAAKHPRYPNARSSHSSPTPRAGGLALVATYAVALPVLQLDRLIDLTSVIILLVCGGIVAVAGFVDDRHSLPASVRLCAHVLAAGIFLIWMYRQSAPWLPAVGFGNVWVGALCALFALTWSTNLFNFMDGIDGLAGSEAVFVTAAAAWINSRQGDPGITAAMLCLCAASAGFLIWNWPPARIFMGDVGSGFLGLMIPMLELEASVRGAIPLQVWVILGGLFLSDATVTLMRRIIGGQRWAEAHRSHAYQRLARRYQSHRLVTLGADCDQCALAAALGLVCRRLAAARNRKLGGGTGSDIFSRCHRRGRETRQRGLSLTRP